MADQNTPTYKYYLLGEEVPIRVSLDDQGRPFNAEVPDPKGNLVTNMLYLGRVSDSFEVEEIDQKAFDQKLLERKSRNTGPIR